MREYDLIADWYAARRSDMTGVPEVRALISGLRPRADVLDVGCGHGLPLTRLFVEAGCRVLGLDSSSRMLEAFTATLPGVPTICTPIETADLGGRRFDAVHAWGVIFHLTHEAQRRAFGVIADALVEGGTLLFTAGDVDGSKEGEPMNGVPFHYYSFTVDGYRALLATLGLRLDSVHKDDGQNCYYRATRLPIT